MPLSLPIITDQICIRKINKLMIDPPEEVNYAFTE